MNGLRWTIGIVTGLVTIAWIAFVTIAGNFRRSFGASEKGPWMLLAGMALFLAILASVIWPERRVLLHIVAVSMVALAIGCFFLARDTVFMATIGLIYVGCWFAFYYRAVWATSVAPSVGP